MVHTLNLGRDSSEPELAICVYGVLRLPDGRPLVHLSYVDQKVARVLNTTTKQMREAARR